MSVGFSSAEFWRVSWRYPGRAEGVESGLRGARRVPAGGQVGAEAPVTVQTAAGNLGSDLEGVGFISGWGVAKGSEWTHRCPCAQWGCLSLGWRLVSPERQRKQNWLEQRVLTWTTAWRRKNREEPAPERTHSVPCKHHAQWACGNSQILSIDSRRSSRDKLQTKLESLVTNRGQENRRRKCPEFMDMWHQGQGLCFLVWGLHCTGWG